MPGRSITYTARNRRARFSKIIAVAPQITCASCGQTKNSRSCPAHAARRSRGAARSSSTSNGRQNTSSTSPWAATKRTSLRHQRHHRRNMKPRAGNKIIHPAQNLRTRPGPARSPPPPRATPPPPPRHHRPRSCPPGNDTCPAWFGIQRAPPRQPHAPLRLQRHQHRRRPIRCRRQTAMRKARRQPAPATPPRSSSSSQRKTVICCRNPAADRRARKTSPRSTRPEPRARAASRARPTPPAHNRSRG